MTNQQLYLAIGLPCLLVLLNTGLMLYLFSRIESRVDKIDAKIDSKIDSLRTELGGKIDKLAADYTQFYGEQSRHDERLSALERERQRPQA